MIKLNVSRNEQIIVPIRFDRAYRGTPRRDSPDLDDRGFAMGTRPSGWSASDARGAMTGICVNDTVKIRVLREDIEESAKLFISSSDVTILEIVSPASGTELASDGIFEVKALQSTNSSVKIQVHFGAQNGPVIGEMEPHIFEIRTLRIRFHMVTINGTGPTRTAGSLVTTLRRVNDIWRPSGIQFSHVDTVNDAVNGLTTAGTITTNLSGVGGSWQCTEFSNMLQLNPHPRAINIYCIRDMADVGGGWLGLTYDKDIARPNGYGVAIIDAASAYDLAHEIGHFLNLDNHVLGENIWALRRLMAEGWPPASPAHRHNVGYGAGQYGALISLKNLAGDNVDNECAIAKRRAHNPY